jgi:alpha-L-arabinofuranosidase
MNNKISNLSRRQLLIGSSLVASSLSLPAMALEKSSIKALVNAKTKRPKISPFIYGGFLEHIGSLINHSLWSEVLDDRKFYYGVLEKPDEVPTDRRAARSYVNKWIAMGSMKAFSLDTKNTYVGEHSPSIKLSGSSSGITQYNLALAAKEYQGRLVLSSDVATTVTISLIWGDAKSDRVSVEIESSTDWQTKTFSLSCPVETTSGRIEITAKGKGQLRLGAVSLMPEDNVQGFRADTLALMREMDCKILRVPGGNFLSAYDWKNTIGDLDKRPPIFDPVWKAVQPNDVGLNELLQLCELIKCEPYWCVNTGSGEPRSGAELVEYVNGSSDTFWGAQRAAHGRKEPYKVKYWNIGNEMYGHWQFGHMARDQYTIKHNMFADAMRKVDPSIYIIVPGGFVDEMTTGQGIFIEGQPQVHVGSERDWAYGMLKNSWGKFDALATHAYPPENKRFDLKTGKLFDVQQSLQEWSRQMPNRVRTMVDAWEEYKKLFPELNKGTVKVFFDEWAFHFQDDLQGCLAVAMTFHEFFRHTDFIDMAGYTMATGWLDFNRTQSIISTRGRVFQLYNQHFGSIPIAVDGNSPQPAPQYPIGGDQPKVNSGSPTYPLDLSASLTADGKTLVLAVVNPTESTQKFQVGFEGFKHKAVGKNLTFAGPRVDSRNQVGKEPEVVLRESQFNAKADSLEVAPLSINLYHYYTV